MYVLPSLPATLRALTDEEIERVNRDHPRPEGKTIDDWCPTCWGEKKFDFYAPDDMALPHQERRVDTYGCDCPAQFQLWRLFHRTGLGEHYGHLNWGDVLGVDPAIFLFITRYLDSVQMHLRQGTGLFLHGRNGNGKTLLSSLVFRKLLALGYSGCWTTYNEMLALYTSGWRDAAEKAWFDATVQRADVLVIDDLGKESVSFANVSMPALDLVFRARMQAGHVTIITTNMDEDQYHERYSSSMVSLVTEACLSREFTAEDWRPTYSGIKEYEVSKGIVRPYTLR